MAHLLGYARVSTVVQDEALQLDGLNAAGCVRVYTDHVSSRVARRPELDRLLERADAGDTIVVWRLDRLGRSLTELIDIVTALGERGVQLRSLREDLDTSTPAGRLLFHIMASIAEFERDLIQERTKAGLAAARARGRVGGRPRALTDVQARAARQMYDSKDFTVAAIAESLSVSRHTIYRYLQNDTTKESCDDHAQQHDDAFVVERDATTTASESALSLDEQLHLRNIVASAGFEGHDVDAEERGQLVKIIAGRLSFEDAFAQAMATVPAEAFVHPCRR